MYEGVKLGSIVTYEPREYHRLYPNGEPTKLGITTPLEGQMELLGHILGWQADTAASLGLVALGYNPSDCVVSDPRLRVIQGEGGAPDVPATFGQLPNLGANGLETPGFNGGFYFRRGTTHDHGFTG